VDPDLVQALELVSLNSSVIVLVAPGVFETKQREYLVNSGSVDYFKSTLFRVRLLQICLQLLSTVLISEFIDVGKAGYNYKYISFLIPS
jgi:hypothetical protein